MRATGKGIRTYPCQNLAFYKLLYGLILLMPVVKKKDQKMLKAGRFPDGTDIEAGSLCNHIVTEYRVVRHLISDTRTFLIG